MVSRIDVFLIGKIFQATILGFYTRAQSLDSMIKQFSSNSLIAVALPYFSRIKHDTVAVKDYYMQCVHIISFVALLLTGSLYVTALDLFPVLFTSKWIFAGEIFQIIALSSFVYPLSALMVNVILAMGKTKAIIRLEVFKKMVLIPVFLFGFFSGIKLFLYLLVGAYWVVLLLNAYFISKVLQVSLRTQVGVIAKYIFVTGLCVFIIQVIANRFDLNNLLSLISKGIGFLVLYLAVNYIFKSVGFTSIVEKGLSSLRTKGILKTV
jgi:O-antigen/teichoic acid export membrane protein